MTDLTDQQLVKRYLKGEEVALEVLIKRYLKPVFGFVFRNIGNEEAAQDITQEVFVKVWKNIKKFDCEKSFKSWIFTIAKNSSIDFLRQKKQTLPLKEDIVGEKSDFQENMENISLARKIHLSLNELSPSYRLVILLKTESNLTFREIAKELNEPLNTIKSRYRRALSLLRELVIDL